MPIPSGCLHAREILALQMVAIANKGFPISRKQELIHRGQGCCWNRLPVVWEPEV